MIQIKSLCSWGVNSLLLFGVLVLHSCQKEAILEVKANMEKHQVLHGETVILNLAGDTGLIGFASDDVGSDDVLKAMTYMPNPDKNGLPKLELPEVGQKLPVLCIFRKLGEPNTTTYSNLQWTVKERENKTKYIAYEGSVQLASGDFLKDDDGKWYMMAVVGGRSEYIEGDFEQARVYVDAKTLYQTNEAGKLVADIPYVMSWTPLNIKRENGYAEHKTLKFRPQGSLLRINVRNGMVSDYRVTALKISANTFANEGYMNIAKSQITDEMLTAETKVAKPDGSVYTFAGKLPEWHITQRNKSQTDVERGVLFGRDTKGLWAMDAWGEDTAVEESGSGGQGLYYSTYTYPEPETVHSGAEGKAYYAWILPTEADKAQVYTQFYVEATSTENTGLLPSTIPVHRSTIKMQSGVYYYAYPEITSDLIISRVLINLKSRTLRSNSVGRRQNFPTISINHFTDYLRYSDDDGFEDEDAPDFAPPEGEGAVSPSSLWQPNLSMIELYNPTLDTIDLRQYGLVRNIWKDDSGETKPLEQRDITFHKYNKNSAEGIISISQATLFPLEAFVKPQAPFSGVFSAWQGDKGNHSSIVDAEGSPVPRLQQIGVSPMPQLEAGEFRLLPGRTMLIGSSGFLAMKDRNVVDSEDDKQLKEAIITKVNESIQNGHCQYALSYCDGSFHPSEGFVYSAYDAESGTLDIGNALGLLLIKKNGSDFRVIDTSIPYPSEYIDNQGKTDIQRNLSLFIAEYSNRQGDETHFNFAVPKGYERIDGFYHACVSPMYLSKSVLSSYWRFMKPEAYVYGKRQSMSQFRVPKQRFWPKR